MEEVRQQMEEALGLLRQELAAISPGRATPALIEEIKVEAYGRKMVLRELATIAVGGPNQLLVTPFDQNIIKEIHRALTEERYLGLQAVVDKNLIRVNLPPLTEERRQELVKVLRQKLEMGRVKIRQIRRQKLIEIRRQSEAKELSEDEKFAQEEALQKLTDEYGQKIEEMGREKEEAILSG